MGSGIAKNIEYIMRPIKGDYQRYRIISFPGNDSRTLRFSLSGKRGATQEISLYVFYTDLLDNEYEQTLSIFLDCSSNEIKLTTFHITAPKYQKNNEKKM